MINNNRLLVNESSGQGSGQIIWKNLVFTMYRNLMMYLQCHPAKEEQEERGGWCTFVCSHVSLWSPKNCFQEKILSQVAHIISQCWMLWPSHCCLQYDWLWLSQLCRKILISLNTSEETGFNLFPVKLSRDFDKLGTRWKPAAGDTWNKSGFPCPEKYFASWFTLSLLQHIYFRPTKKNSCCYLHF